MNSDSDNGQITTCDLRDFGQAMQERLKNGQPLQKEPVPALSEDEQEAANRLDLDQIERADKELLGHIVKRKKLADTYTHTDTRINIAKHGIEKTRKEFTEKFPVLLHDMQFLQERLEEKCEECEELKKKFDLISDQFIVAAYRANHWERLYQRSLDSLREWHSILIKETHLKNSGNSLRR